MSSVLYRHNGLPWMFAIANISCFFKHLFFCEIQFGIREFCMSFVDFLEALFNMS